MRNKNNFINTGLYVHPRHTALIIVLRFILKLFLKLLSKMDKIFVRKTHRKAFAAFKNHRINKFFYFIS